MSDITRDGRGRKNVFLSLLFVFLFPNAVLGQGAEWAGLVPLESTRAEVERIVGKPEKHFDTYGTYETSYGSYSIWYALGHCRTPVEGRNWNVEAGKMTSLLVYPRGVTLFERNSPALKDFERREHPGAYSQFLYISKDESVIYTTIRRGDSSEILYSIRLDPGTTKQKFLCADKTR